MKNLNYQKSDKKSKMEKPLVLDANICGCAFTGPAAAVWIAVAAVVKVGGPAAAAAVCNVPVVGVVMSVGLTG